MKKLLWRIPCYHGKRQGGDHTRLNYHPAIKSDDGVLPDQGGIAWWVEAETTGRKTVER